ncbi:MAG: OsmC family protein [Chitinophagaceae bacterium]|nr:OsmC family protein [Chitinophagaceae bacterium]
MTSSVVYEGNLRTVCTHQKSSNQIETDAPPDNQGKGERFSPSDLLATSLGSCAMTIMGIKARDMNVDLKDTSVEVEKIMKSEPRRVGGINLTFRFPESVAADTKQRTILERCVHSCPVFHSIHPDIELNVSFTWDAKETIAAS